MRGHRDAPLLHVGLAGLFVALLAVPLILPLYTEPLGHQLDLRTYFLGSIAWKAGQNPYDAKVLSEIGRTVTDRPYVYPPITLPLFTALTKLSPPSLCRAWITMKLLALLALVVLWWRLGVFRLTPLAILAVAIGFNATVLLDMVAGNISLFEQLCLWAGLASLLGGSPWVLALGLAVAAQFKIVLILFAALLAPGFVTRTWRPLIACWALFLGLFAFNWLAFPSDAAAWLATSSNLSERGSICPATLPAMRDIVGMVVADSPGASAISGLLYAGAVLGLTLAFGLAVKRSRESRQEPGQRQLDTVLFATVLFALILPRFKDYSYILLLPAALNVLQRQWPVPGGPAFLFLSMLPNDTSPLRMAGAMEFVRSYSCWLAALLIFGVYYSQLGAPAGQAPSKGKG